MHGLPSRSLRVGKAATILNDKKVVGKNILINCDSQSAIRAINSTVIKTHTIEQTTRELNDLGRANNVLLRWMPAHKGHEGNETADSLAKNGANNCDEPELVKLPIPRGVCYAALRRKTLSDWCRTFAVCPPKVFYTMWRDRFSRGLLKMGKRDLRVATQILTGHAELNYHLRKLNRDIAPTCSLCPNMDAFWNRPDIRLNPVPAGYPASKSGSGSGPVSKPFAGF
ncbi:hypothetical protein ACHWQZ_G014710 [Mnemiopsis leidyi]